MEELVAIIAKEGLVAGGFIYMLYHFLSKFTVTQELIVKSISEVSKEMTNISTEMGKLNERVDKLENNK